MSTYFYLRCLDHEPPLTASEESGQHHYDLPQIRKDVANRDVLVQAWNDDVRPSEYYRSHTVAFLAAHPTCKIEIRDEYQRTYSLTGEDGDE